MTRFRFYEVPATIAPNEPTGGQVQFDSIPGTDIMARKRTSLTRQRIRREAEMITAGLLLQCNQSPIDIMASNDVKSRQDEAACLAEGSLLEGEEPAHSTRRARRAVPSPEQRCAPSTLAS